MPKLQWSYLWRIQGEEARPHPTPQVPFVRGWEKTHLYSPIPLSFMQENIYTFRSWQPLPHELISPVIGSQC